MPKKKRNQTYQIITNYVEICIPSLSSIFLAVHTIYTLLCTYMRFKKLFYPILSNICTEALNKIQEQRNCVVAWFNGGLGITFQKEKKIVTYQLSVIGFGPTKSQSVSFVQLIRQFGVQRNTIFGLRPCFVQIPSRLRSM